MSCWWRGECFAHLPRFSECVTWMISLCLLKMGVRKGNVHVEVGSGVFVLKNYFRFFRALMHLQQCLNVIWYVLSARQCFRMFTARRRDYMWEQLQLHTYLYLGAQTCAFNVITCYLVLVSEWVVLCIQRDIYIYVYWLKHALHVCILLYNICWLMYCRYILFGCYWWPAKNNNCQSPALFNKSNWCIEKKHISIEHIFFKFSLANDYIYSWKKTVIYQKKSAGKKYTCFNPPPPL